MHFAGLNLFHAFTCASKWNLWLQTLKVLRRKFEETGLVFGFRYIKLVKMQAYG